MMRIDTSTCKPARPFVLAHTYICIHTKIHTHPLHEFLVYNVCTHICMYIFVSLYIYIFVSLYIYIYVYTYIDIYTSTYAHGVVGIQAKMEKPILSPALAPSAILKHFWYHHGDRNTQKEILFFFGPKHLQSAAEYRCSERFTGWQGRIWPLSCRAFPANEPSNNWHICWK